MSKVYGVVVSDGSLCDVHEFPTQDFARGFKAGYEAAHIEAGDPSRIALETDLEEEYDPDVWRQIVKLLKDARAREDAVDPSPKVRGVSHVWMTEAEVNAGGVSVADIQRVKAEDGWVLVGRIKLEEPDVDGSTYAIQFVKNVY